MNADLLVLEQRPDDPDRLRSVFRVAHTLKGAARAGGVPLVEQACHRLETLLADVRDGKVRLEPARFASLFAAADALEAATAALRKGDPLTHSPLADWLAGFRDGPGMTARAAAPPAATRPAAPPAAPVATTEPPATPAPDTTLRVRADRLDALMASAGRLLGSRREAEARVEDLETLHLQLMRTATEWKRAARRVHTTLARFGTGAEVRQSLRHTEEQLRLLVSRAERLAVHTAAHTRVFDGITHDVLGQVRQLRMRPFAEACEALPRVVRDVAGTTKQARLVVMGGDLELDRAVLDGLREALVHIVRNAVDHGIESPPKRVATGKDPTGAVTVAATRTGDRVAVTVTDDGAGIDVAAIRRLLERRGLDVPADDQEVARILFAGGVSTRLEPTVISGRGVGMDLVRAAIERVGGSLDLRWTPGAGTTLTLTCPPTLASVRAVLMTVGQQTVAIPTADVERMLRVPVAALRRIEGRDVVLMENEPLPLTSLARLLPPLTEQPLHEWVLIVVVRSGDRRLALSVDALLSEEELFMQPLSRGGRRSPLLSGAAMLATSSLALVLDTAATVTQALTDGTSGLTIAEPAPGAPTEQRILVVDDSMTTRTLLQGILETAGYHVRTAVDGADGWRLLQETGDVDLVVSDIEMPRMDGFALCEAIRGSQRFRDLPVILVTALETDAHRTRGLEAGADAYLGKSSFDQQGLVNAVHHLLG